MRGRVPGRRAERAERPSSDRRCWPIVRYEVAIRPGFTFGHGLPDFGEITEPIEITQANHTYVWHPARPAPDSNEMCGPVLSVMWPDSDSYAAGLACNRFLAVLSYALDQPIGIGIGVDVGVGFKQPLDRPMMCQPAPRPTLMLLPVAGVAVQDDALLYRLTGLYREGRAAESPYVEFLWLHNALVISFDGSEDDAQRYATSRQADVHDPPDDASDLGHYFREVLRNAIAHTVRTREDQPSLDPNDPADRARAAAACAPIRQIVRWRVTERWADGQPRCW